MAYEQEVRDINQLLIDHFGIDTSSSHPIWRVVWSDDQWETRLSDTTLEGIRLLYPERMRLLKYSHIRDRWILECLSAVPEINQEELCGLKISYEQRWTFEDKNGNPLPPTFWACKFVIDTIHAATGRKSLRKYVDPEATEEGRIQAKKERTDRLVEELFGDESDLMLKTVTGEAVAYTGEPKIKSENSDNKTNGENNGSN